MTTETKTQTRPAAKRYVQLNVDDCIYLQELMECDLADFCAKRRLITAFRIEKYKNSPTNSRIDINDVEYLLSLIECDNLEDTEQQREMTKATLLEIEELQLASINRRDNEAIEIEKRKALFASRRHQPDNPVLKPSDLIL